MTRRLSLECLPDFYEAEVQLADHTETSLSELVFTETTVRGDYPARVRVVVDEDDGDAQLGLIWGFRNRHYSSASTARLAYEAEALGVVTGGTAVALTGASGGTAVRSASLQTFWQPVLTTDMAGTAALTHTGSYRVWVRAHTTAGTAATDLDLPQLRFVYGTGQAVRLVENARVEMPGGAAFYNMDLGSVRLDPAPTGTHRWRGVVQSLGGTAGQTVSLDKLWFQPLDEYAGILRAEPSSVVGQVPLTASDDFASLAAAAVLNGRTAPLGGTWSTAAAGAGGSTTDFTGDGAGHITRATISDGLSGALRGRRAMFSPTYTEVEVGGDFWFSAFPTADAMFYPGALARYVDASNFAAFTYVRVWGGHAVWLYIYVAGVITVLGTASVPALTSTWLTLRLQTKATGQIVGRVYLLGSSSPLFTVSGGHSALATGGALASGLAGIQDYNGSTTASTRLYTNVYAAGQASGTPVPTDVVLEASQSLELRHDGVFREELTGNSYVPVTPIGDLPRLPPTVESRPTEVFIKASRGDFSSPRPRYRRHFGPDRVSPDVAYGAGDLDDIRPEGLEERGHRHGRGGHDHPVERRGFGGHGDAAGGVHRRRRDLTHAGARRNGGGRDGQRRHPGGDNSGERRRGRHCPATPRRLCVHRP